MKLFKNSLIAAVLLAMIVSSVASAQVTYPEPALSSYSVVNLDTAPQTISVTYYDGAGDPKKTVNFPGVAANGGSVTVQQALETGLPSGDLSAVISSNGPLAAVVNQQLGTVGNGTSIAPFSSYTASSSGASPVTLPEVMYNWFGYYSDIYIQNVGSGPANVTVTYTPGKIGACVTGATGQSDAANNLAKYASKKVSQVSKSSLGAPSVSGCGSFTGRFLGAATVTSTQPIVVIVNQTVQNKLFTYNGFTAKGQNLIAPAYLRNWYNYYASMTIANPGGTDAQIELIYKPGEGANPTANIVANRTVPAGASITIYDGPTATADQSDLLTQYPYGTTKRFFGSVTIKSTNGVDVVAKVNQEASVAAGNQAGAYNVPFTTEGTKKISVPLIQSDFYGYYTSLTIASVDGSNPTVKITYTSDNQFSSVKNQSKSYTHTLANGFLNRYEGVPASASQQDIFDDPFWASGGQHKFIGSALIEVTSGSNIVAYVNSESNTAPQAATRDSMYTFNAVNLQ